jgi:hypothetical protein
MTKANRWRVKWLAAVSAIAVTGVAFALLLPPIERNREAAKANACQGHFTGIGTAMRDYYKGQGHYPPAFIPDKDGKPAHSWRVLLLEYTDPTTFNSYRFDEPWNGPNNRKLESSMPSFYACPADADSERKWRTNYFVVIGSDTVFPGAKTTKLDDIKRPKGETILVVEAVGQDVHWMEPKDLMLESMSFEQNDPKKPSVSSYHKRSPGVYMVDGTMLWLDGIKADRLKQMFSIKNEDK